MLVVIETYNIAVFIATSAASAWKHSFAAGAGSCSKLAAALLYNIGVDGLLFMSRVQTEDCIRAGAAHLQFIFKGLETLNTGRPLVFNNLRCFLPLQFTFVYARGLITLSVSPPSNIM